jgi:26S proteasome regulatory subunit N1
MIMMWNIEEGLNIIDKYYNNSSDEYIKAGACLGIGILSSGIRNESDPAFALLSETATDAKASSTIRLTSVCGLGLAYCGTGKMEVKDLLEGIVCNSDASIAEVSMAALSLGLIFVGSCDEGIAVLFFFLMIFFIFPFFFCQTFQL